MPCLLEDVERRLAGTECVQKWGANLELIPLLFKGQPIHFVLWCLFLSFFGGGAVRCGQNGALLLRVGAFLDVWT